MSHLEDDLRHSLERLDPPAGFAERVASMAGAPRENVVPLALYRRHGWMLWIAAAAAAVVIAVGAWGITTRRNEPLEPASAVIAAAPVAPAGTPPATLTDAEDPQPVAPDLDVGRGNVGPTSGWSRRSRTARDTARPAASDAAAQAEAQHATEQLRIALNITSSKLMTARRAAQTKITIPAS